MGVFDKSDVSKEFETLGFFISDHPLNQYKDLYTEYNILEYSTFNNNNEISIKKKPIY